MDAEITRAGPRSRPLWSKPARRLDSLLTRGLRPGTEDIRCCCRSPRCWLEEADYLAHEVPGVSRRTPCTRHGTGRPRRQPAVGTELAADRKPRRPQAGQRRHLDRRRGGPDRASAPPRRSRLNSFGRTEPGSCSRPAARIPAARVPCRPCPPLPPLAPGPPS